MSVKEVIDVILNCIDTTNKSIEKLSTAIENLVEASKTNSASIKKLKEMVEKLDNEVFPPQIYD
jgi:septation ring formation regulator EzrA